MFEHQPANAPHHEAALRLDAQLCFALYATSLAMTKAYKPLLEPLGITYPQYLVLLVLWEHGEQTVGQLGDKLALDSGTLTPMTKRMAQLQLLTRRRSAADERQVLLGLTPRAREIKEVALNIPPCVLQLSGCTLPQLADLTQQLHALRQQMSAKPSLPIPFPSTSPTLGEHHVD